MSTNDTLRQRATIYDVAERAGVAISTVSRVLNNSDDVSDATRERVRSTIADLKFRPDRTAKSLAKRQVPTFAMAFPTFTTPFHNELLKGVRLGLNGVTVDLLICDLGWKQPQKTLYDFLQRGAVDGLLLANVPLDEPLVSELQALGAPTVLIGDQWDDIHSFYWDEIRGASIATQHLIDRGHKRIGMILPPIESPPASARLNGYKQALRENNLDIDDGLVAAGDTTKHAGFSEEAGYEAMNKLLDSGQGVTAVFAGSDVHAVGAWMAMRERSLKAPDDIAIIGYDDVKTSAFIGLSSIDQQMHEVGSSAAKLLIRTLNDPAIPAEHRTIEPILRVRETS